jgi:dihydroorotate dehydrogenase electron transfer subunit
MDFLKTHITKVERPAAGYVLLRFQNDRPIEGVPGQFVMIRGEWGVDPILPRAFSLVETGSKGAVLVHAVGKGTKLLVQMEPGDVLDVLGPCGKGFSLPPAGRRPVLVAGGVGVAPMVYLAENLLRDGHKPTSLFGGRTAADLPLHERLAASGELIMTTEDGSIGEKGLVTGPLERLLKEDKTVQLYSCGPEPMLRAVARAAEAHGIPCEVALESPMACGIGTCKGCAVQAADGSFLYVCSDGPVFDAVDIYGGTK